MSKELILLTLYLVILAYIVIARKTQYVIPALVALAIGVTWTFVVGDVYSYNTATMSLFGVNLYAMLGWSLGLLVGYMLYTKAMRRTKPGSIWKKSLLFTAIYVPILLLVETVAYHAFNVVNVGTITHAGLPICDCIHAPTWMQASYLLMGTVYFVVVQAVYRVVRSPLLAADPQTSQR